MSLLLLLEPFFALLFTCEGDEFVDGSMVQQMKSSCNNNMLNLETTASAAELQVLHDVTMIQQKKVLNH